MVNQSSPFFNNVIYGWCHIGPGYQLEEDVCPGWLFSIFMNAVLFLKNTESEKLSDILLLGTCNHQVLNLILSLCHSYSIIWLNHHPFYSTLHYYYITVLLHRFTILALLSSSAVLLFTFCSYNTLLLLNYPVLSLSFSHSILYNSHSIIKSYCFHSLTLIINLTFMHFPSILLALSQSLSFLLSSLPHLFPTSHSLLLHPTPSYNYLLTYLLTYILATPSFIPVLLL